MDRLDLQSSGCGHSEHPLQRSPCPSRFGDPGCTAWFAPTPDTAGPSGQALPAGWLLAELRVITHPPPERLWLHLETPSSDQRAPAIQLPVNARGRVAEILWIPPGTGLLGIALQVPAGQPVELSPLRLNPLGLARRYWRYLRRVVPALWRIPVARRRRFGITVWRSLLNLPRAYRAVPRLRRQAASAHRRWIRQHDTLSERDRALIRADMRRYQGLPRFKVLVEVRDPGGEALERTLDSLRGQLYRDFSVLVLDHDGTLGLRGDAPVDLSTAGVDGRLVPAPSIARALADLDAALAASPEPIFLDVLRAGDRLAEHALYWTAAEARSHPEAGLIYSDEDRIGADGARSAPCFKPDWSPTLQRCGNYIGQLAAIRADVWQRSGGLAALPPTPEDNGYALSLRIIDALAGSAARHIPAILCHRDAGAPRWNPAGSLPALAAHLRCNGIVAQVEPIGSVGLHVRHALTRQPLVSILIPTRDAPGLLARCLGSLLERTQYPRWELLLVDNGTSDPNALAILTQATADPRVRVLRDPRPFNYAALNNTAAQEARGEVLCLLNNDTEVLTPDWLDEMLGHLLQERVGVVGAKLLYPDGRVQHGGDIFGPDGVGRHLHALLPRDAPGYCNRAALAQELTAVTAACLLTWKALFLRLGGLDARHLPIAYSDLDYCLRVRQAGYLVRWTPHATLTHWESVSRWADESPARARDARRAARRLRARWGKSLRSDPYYNPNLDADRADFSLSPAPRVRRPWR